ncbi:thylakoid membrane photosystem I accumulation factor [cf. Phormidesmis sp. LEGE 11477]|uniref:thylakoid membrane photosystem I accumulation factor n=1 Tax=cf. Phormidesmis sp. LEGE 11477 TaxID=1828680 RepID=UPI001882E9C3|nr:thylakoid membrane photosystem I accumulation factor [cf. Phormidesmis sp. LEGE 11477]MBE9060119.1 thylakoid membrane photosystem I accumulation factor [cf. Phormidesmis sp. LEGE 11477]
MVVQFFRRFGLIALCAIALFSIWTTPAWAGIDDDNYDGNIFALYAGNGSIVPPKFNLAQSFKQDKPTLLFFYVDDSRDSKVFSPVVSQLQAPYGRAANFVPVAADSIPVKDDYEPNEAGYYFKGSVPQTVVFDAKNNVVLNEVGQVSYEKVDDKLREVFDLLPREESVELRRRPVNEVNSELVAE